MPVAPLILNKTTKMKTKKVTISLTQEQQDKAKKDSIEVFGKENLSGYIQVLIQNGFAKTKERGAFFIFCPNTHELSCERLTPLAYNG